MSVNEHLVVASESYVTEVTGDQMARRAGSRRGKRAGVTMGGTGIRAREEARTGGGKLRACAD